MATMNPTSAISNLALTSYLKKNSSGAWYASTAESGTRTIDFDINTDLYDIVSVVLTVTVSSVVLGDIKINNNPVQKDKTHNIQLEARRTNTVNFYWKSGWRSGMQETQTCRFTNMSAVLTYTEKNQSGMIHEMQVDFLPRVVTIEPKGSGYTCVFGRFLHPVKLSMEQKAVPFSTARMTLYDDLVEVGTLLQLRTPHGDAGLYVVKNVKADYFNGMRYDVTMEHAFCVSKESIILVKVGPSSINKGTGDSSTSTSLALNALKYAFERLHTSINSNPPLFEWYLNEQDFAFPTIRNDWTFETESVWDAINDVTDCLQKFEWRFTYDYENARGYAHLLKQDTEVTAEIRQARNATRLVVTVDRNGMYNVCYPVGKNGKTIDSITSTKVWYKDGDSSSGRSIQHNGGARYIIDSESIQKWGRSVAIKNDSSKDDMTSLMNWAASEMWRNNEPFISITVDALQLSGLTGISIDRLSVGKRCRIPLPQFDTYFEDRIVSAEWPDLIATPNKITLTIANERRTVESITAKEKKTTAKKLVQLLGGTSSGGTGDYS